MAEIRRNPELGRLISTTPGALCQWASEPGTAAGTPNPTGRGTNLDAQRSHHDLLVPRRALALHLIGDVGDHVVQVPVLQLLGDALLPVLPGGQCLSAVVAVPVVVLRDRSTNVSFLGSLCHFPPQRFAETQTEEPQTTRKEGALPT